MINDKITFFLPVIKTGGAEKVYINLGKSFLKLGYNVEILTLRCQNIENFNFEGLRIVNLNKSRILFSIFALYKYIKVQKPDYFFSTLIHSNLISLFIKIFLRTNSKFIIREANIPSLSMSDLFFLKRKVFNFLIKLIYPYADKIISVTEGIKNDLIINFKIKKNLISTIYNPIDKEEIILKSNYNFESDFNPKDFFPYFICVGSLTKQKNHEFLIKVIKEINKKKKCYLIIIGSGYNLDYLESISQKLDLKDNIIFLGNIINPFPYMKHSTGLILPSLWEGLPNILIESLCLNIPIIASNSSDGVENILKNGELGDIFDINDDKKLINLLLNKLNKKKLINTNNDLARFDTLKITKSYINIINDLK